MKCYSCPNETPAPHIGICDPCLLLRTARLKCATPGCLKPKRENGKSKYCPECARVARAQWRDNVAAADAERQRKYERFEAAYQAAEVAALAASDAARPTPMHIAGYAPVEGGACGFAWVQTAKGNTSFSKWVTKTKGRNSCYRGGVYVFWCPGGGTQSMERHIAASEAACKVLREMVPEEMFYTGSRMD